MQRVEIKKMLHEWEQRYPGRIESIFSALCNVVPSHLADTNAFDFASLVTEAVDCASEIKDR
jgi:tRNA 2-thiocytidine biosynthesis protein TtcA